ncbi:SDR family oxidoreductase [Frankia sp. AgB32]|uniref:SDR family NAD(P)-dependent oxidoreductase n=1 Tax=Frankia sp. AgB32 TaxID=631119 RepID=UPI00200BE38E|nr:SDR family oxidoreductase [Frankia sp. AgB32]MCK9896619.1 SDR family oxidoreductase [Frankia sp. AgB32]
MSTPSVVITGAASGIGRACVRLFAERGFGVVAVDVDEAGLAALAGPGGTDAGPAASIVPLVGDVARKATGTAMVQAALERFGRLDVAVLNAGIGGTLPWAHEDAIDRLDRILAVNVRGVAIGIRSVVPAIRSGGGGSIVVTASSAGLAADAGNWAYNASKGAVINLVRAAALDHAAEGIRVNAIAPGLTDTPLMARHRTDPHVVDAVGRRIPLQRWGRAEEHAAAIFFLASPDASYVTGATLAADGGLTAMHGAVPPPARPEI